MKSANNGGGTKLSARIMALVLAALMIGGAAYYIVAMIAGLL